MPDPLVLLANAAGKVSRIALQLGGRGGTALPGLIALRIDPDFIAAVTSELAHGVVLVSGTNGTDSYLAGTPTTPGDYRFTVVVTDGSAPQQSVTVPMTLSGPVVGVETDVVHFVHMKLLLSVPSAVHESETAGDLGADVPPLARAVRRAPS